MICYHGTNKDKAKVIIGPPNAIDVTIGKGELGRGFYAGENVALAASFSTAKFGDIEKAILKIEIDDSDFVSLNIKTVKRQELLYRSWQNLRRKKKTASFLYQTDVVIAPFATMNLSYQYKFESIKSQDTLNNSEIKIL